MSSITSPVTVSDPGFSGTSKFASSLQQVLSRAVGIASLPLNSLTAGLNTLNSKEAALQGLDTTFSALEISISSLQSTVSSGLLNTSVSDGSIVSAQVQAGASAGVYSLEVQSLGSFSTALSSAGTPPVADVTTQGLTSASSLVLTIGTSTTTIIPATSSLQDLSSAINAQSGGQVQATVVNVGSTGSPDYRLSLRSTSLGSDAIDLKDSLGADLISTSTPGSLATYKVDGTDTISSSSRTVTLSPGLTVNLLGQSAAGKTTNVTVANNPAAVSSAFSSFAQAYNSAVDAVSQQRGQNSGAIQGDSILQQLNGVLSQLGTYDGGSPASALANYGVTLDQNGHLSVDDAAFTTAANANFSNLLSTLGGSTTGGFLKTATDLISGVEDATNGALKNAETSVTDQVTTQQTRIKDEQATVAQLQTNLTAQIAKADAAIALLESQVSYVTGLFATFTGANSTQSNGLSTL